MRTVKRKNIITLACAAVLMAAAVSGRSLLMSEGAMPYIKADAELKVRPEMPQVVLDAGHGGMDGGCVSVNGVAEKGINLAIVQSESDMLTLLGFETVLTRDSDKSIYDDGVTGLGEQKKSDMKNRLAIFSSTKGIALSIHQNQFTDSRYSGAQMFYSRRNSGGEKLAAAMQKQFVALLQPDNARETKPVDDELFLLDRTEAPAVMIECGFLSNPEEAAHLEDPVYQRKVAFTIASGVLSFHAGEIGS